MTSGAMYRSGKTESVTVGEIPIGAVSYDVRFVFDAPFILSPDDLLTLDNGEWFLLRPKEEQVKQEGMWKVRDA